MRNFQFKILSLLSFAVIAAAAILISSCSKDNSLAPYAGSDQLSKITVEDSSFTPRISWVGGYVSVVGVNAGSHAALDSNLIWLVHTSGNNIHYKVKFGETPAGGEDLTTQYGGTPEDTLIEDSTYTFWVMKESDWNQISSMQNKIIVLDSTLTTSFVVDGDTLRFSPESHTQKTQYLDNYVNFLNYAMYGRLGPLLVEQPKSSNNPRISWQVTEEGIDDSLIAAMGIVEGNSYDPSNVVWEVYSQSDSAGITYYGKQNVIPSPLIAGQEFPGTFLFTPYPETGLKRNTSYYVWIANRYWDGEGRTRVVNYYAYATFNTY